jgi:hypothetical protein
MILSIDYDIKMKTTKYEEDFNRFDTLRSNCGPTRYLYIVFYLPNNTSKDVEFRGLSNYIIISIIIVVYRRHNFKKQRKKFKKIPMT